MNTIAWIGFCQGLFAALLMFTKKDNSVPDKILSGWLTLLAFEFMTCALDQEIFGEPLLSSSFLLFNPSMYLYIKSLTQSDFRLKWIQLLHLAPFLAFETAAYVIQEPFSLDHFFVRDENFIFRIVFGIANFASWSIYNPLSILVVHRYRMNLKDEQSNIDKNENLGWILSIAIFYVVYCGFAIIISTIVYFEGFRSLIPYVYNYSILLFMIFALSFYGLRQQETPRKFSPREKSIPYKNSTLTDEIKEKIKKKITDYFEKEKAYLNPDMNMDLLSTTLKIPKYQITEVLNTCIGKNFFQFVNAYRVESVKKMLTDPENNFSIEAIGYECGFSSKSSFYTVFKQLTSMTPIAYKQHAESGRSDF